MYSAGKQNRGKGGKIKKRVPGERCLSNTDPRGGTRTVLSLFRAPQGLLSHSAPNADSQHVLRLQTLFIQPAWACRLVSPLRFNCCHQPNKHFTGKKKQHTGKCKNSSCPCSHNFLSVLHRRQRNSFGFTRNSSVSQVLLRASSYCLSRESEPMSL